MDDNWLSGGCQILRFPGFIVSPDRKQVYKDCTVHCSTVEMAKHLPEHELADPELVQANAQSEGCRLPHVLSQHE